MSQRAFFIPKTVAAKRSWQAAREEDAIALLIDNVLCSPYNPRVMNAAEYRATTATTGNSAGDRGLVSLMIAFTCAVVLAGLLFGDGSIAWAQLDGSRQSTFRLVGTIEGGPFTGAVIEDAKNPQAFYRLNEKLPDESQIVKVLDDHIVLKWPDGTRTELYKSQGTAGGGGIAPAGSPIAASPASAHRVDPPTPSPNVVPNRGRAAPVRMSPSADAGQNAAGRRPPRADLQDPNQQGAQVQDAGKKKKGGAGRRSRIRPDD